MLRRSRRSHQHTEPSDNLDRWMVSYADFITLLFAFFVVMYAISSVNEGKYRTFGAALFEAFGSHREPRPEAVTPLSENEMLLKSLVARRNARLAEKLRKQQEQLQLIAKNLGQAMAPLVNSGQVSVTETARGVVLDIKASVLFDQGDADLQPASINTLTQVAAILETGEQAIEVEGYTDDVPISTPRFPSNWELSSARASSVARLFIERGVAAGRLTVVGSAANHPVAPNDTPEGRARNRRITVTLMAPAPERLQQVSVQ